MNRYTVEDSYILHKLLKCKKLTSNQKEALLHILELVNYSKN